MHNCRNFDICLIKTIEQVSLSDNGSMVEHHLAKVGVAGSSPACRNDEMNDERTVISVKRKVKAKKKLGKKQTPS
jgi:hypothetical protein